MRIGNSFFLGDRLIEQLSLFLVSGMDIHMALAALEQETTQKRVRIVVTRIREAVEQGVSLSGALSSIGICSAGTMAMIAIGERTGTLPEHLALAADIAEKNRSFRSKIMSAALYPMIVFGVALIVGGMITVGILPRLAGIFSQLHVALPPITQLLIVIGSFVGRIRIDLAVGIFVLLCGGLALLAGHPRVRALVVEMIFRTPGLHRMMMESEVGRFGYLFGTMLDAGVPVFETLTSLADATALPSYRTLYAGLASGLEQGVPLSQTLSSAPRSATLIPRSVQGMIAAGERSGLLKVTLLKIGAVYEVKGEATAKTLATLLEPLLLVMVWLAVLTIAIAVILPIYSLIGELQTH